MNAGARDAFTRWLNEHETTFERGMEWWAIYARTSALPVRLRLSWAVAEHSYAMGVMALETIDRSVNNGKITS